MSNSILADRLAQHIALRDRERDIKAEMARIAEAIAAQCPHAVGDKLPTGEHSWEPPMVIDRITAGPHGYGDYDYVWILQGRVLRQNGEPHAIRRTSRLVPIPKP